MLMFEILGIMVIVVLSVVVGVATSHKMRPDESEGKRRATQVARRSAALRDDNVALTDEDNFFGGFGLTEEARKEKK